MTQGLSIDIDFKQVAKLQQKFTEMESNPERRLMMKHFRAAGTELAKGYRTAAPVGPMSRKLKKLNRNAAIKLERNGLSIKQSAKSRVKAKRGRYVAVKAGYNVGVKKGGKRAYHAHLAILGTKDRYHKTGKYVGKVDVTAALLRQKIGSFSDQAAQKAIARIEDKIFSESIKEWTS
jgi:hypothetical protein